MKKKEIIFIDFFGFVVMKTPICVEPAIYRYLSVIIKLYLKYDICDEVISIFDYIIWCVGANIVFN